MNSSFPAIDPILTAEKLEVSYGGHKVLDIPELFQVMPNRVSAIIGPNGSGKTTLLLCLALLLKPTAGRVLFKGQPIAKRPSITQARRRFAVVFQEPLLLNTTVAENIALGLKLRGTPSQEIRRRMDYWLDRFSIAALAKRHARSLSGGEAQRTSLARAFALQPEVLFLDEPFAALDVPTRQALFGEMVNILQETKFTTVLVTHDRGEAQTLAHRITVLMKGHIVQSGSPQEIFSTPANEEIARFVGMENILEGCVSANRGGVDDIDIRGQVIEGISGCRIGQSVEVFIRPEDITLLTARSSSSARNVFSGRVTALISTGPLVRVHLDCGFPLIALITRLSADELKLETGKTVMASFKATAIHVIPQR
jgi:tungstate transport system ATP-binding protein